MKVIKPGNGAKGWSHEYTCTGAGNEGSGCGAILMVEEGDLILTFSHARDETTRYLTFKCPECGVKTDIDNDDAPKLSRVIWNKVRANETKKAGLK